MGTKILFVDDDALVTRIYRDKLADDGFEVATAEDGLMAMRKALEFRPDLIVLDLLMPKMTGADVLKFIRNHPELKSTRVIVFSNSFLANLVESVGSIGVEETLPKSSATPARLIELIHKVLEAPAPAPAASQASPPPPAARAEPPAPAPKPLPTFFKPPDTPSERRVKDEQFRSRVQDEFARHLPGAVAEIRKVCDRLLAASDPKAELDCIEDLSRKVGFLTQMSTMAGNNPLAQLASALELLLFHLYEKEGPLEDSCRNTIATTVAFLTAQLDPLGNSAAEVLAPANVLVIDDDAVSNRAILHALLHANVSATSETDARRALERLNQSTYDLILLDVELQDANGVELCEHIRSLPLHRTTPVMFITGHSDTKTRSRAVLSGGTDFITKPILPIELTVKVITEVLRGRIARKNEQR